MASKITTSLQALELSDKLLVGKMPPGKAGVPDKVKVNAYRMELTAKQPFYKYDVNIVLTISKEPENIEVSIVQGKKNDSQLRRVKNEAVRIFEYAQKNNRGFFKGLLFYNCMAVLITTEKLNIAPGETKSFPYPLQEFNLDKNKVLEVKLQIKCVKDEFEINPQIEPTAQVNKRLVDLRLLEALNQVVQHVSYNSDQFIKYKNNVIYLLDHEHYGFTNQDAPAIRNRDDLYMGIGQNGAVKTLGGSGGHRLYFVTDVCKSLFHRDYDSLIDKVKTIAGQRWNPNLQKDTAFAREILSNIKGLEVCRQYGKWLNNLDGSGRFVIDHLGECANNVHFEKDGKITTMTAYYKQEYNITLKYPSLFTISPKNKRDVFFPVELLLVAPDQRATMSQIPATVQGDMVRASAVKPFLRERQILNLNRATGVLSPNISAGIKIARDMEMASARILQEPRKLTNNKELVLNPKREIDFTKNRYHKPASVPTMGFYVFGDRLNNFNGEVYKERLITIAKRNGMTFKNVPKAILHRNRPSDAELEKFFQDVRKNGIMFLFLVVQDDYNLHNTIKRLEQKYQVLTQEVRLSKALKSQPQTEQNVIHKMNVKNGGLNYTVKELVDRNLLIIGFTTSRSSAIDKVGVVGYSYNGSSDPCAFIGGYKFVERGEKDKEIFSPVMEEVIKKAIGQVLRSRKTKVDKMIVYINGLSDGLLHDINELYNKKIRAAMGNETIKFSTIAVSRSHVERFFKDNKGKIDNVLPGTVIDDTVVSPVFTEFYLNAHIAIQGTAKTPKYILMTDYIKQSLDKIQELTYALCCLHQIIYTNTALPAPVLIADRYATRGSTNYVSGRTPNDVRTVEQLNQELTYDTRPMDLIRFNA